MTKEMQPEALRLADAFADDDTYVSLLMMREAAAELRRLHAEIEQLRAQCKPLTDEQIEALPCWSWFLGMQPEHRAEITRNIERAHGIGEAAV